MCLCLTSSHLCHVPSNPSKFLTRVAGFAGTLVAIDLVDAGPIVTGIALAVVNVDFTVDSCQEIHFSL